MTTPHRRSTGNQGVSGPHPLRRPVYHEIRGNVDVWSSVFIGVLSDHRVEDTLVQQQTDAVTAYNPHRVLA